MSTSMAALSERSSRRTSIRPPPMAVVLAAFALVVALAEAAALVKSNATYGGGACMECRIAEDLELEMLLVEDLYYATAHVSRMLQDGNGGGTPTQHSGNPGAAPCKTKPGQKSDCSPDKDKKNNKNCANPYNKDC